MPLEYRGMLALATTKQSLAEFNHSIRVELHDEWRRVRRADDKAY
jgi:hypothetical protein